MTKGMVSPDNNQTNKQKQLEKLNEKTGHHINIGPLRSKPHIVGTRLSIEFILELFASGATRDEVLKAYPQLTTEAVEEALKYAAQAVKNEVLLDVKVSG